MSFHIFPYISPLSSQAITQKAQQYLAGWATGTLGRIPRPGHYSFLDHDILRRANLHAVVPNQFRHGAPPRPVSVFQRDGQPVPCGNVPKEDDEAVQLQV